MGQIYQNIILTPYSWYNSSFTWYWDYLRCDDHIGQENTTLSAKKMQNFLTYIDNQPIVHNHIFEGERSMTRDNTILGRAYILYIGIQVTTFSSKYTYALTILTSVYNSTYAEIHCGFDIVWNL